MDIQQKVSISHPLFRFISVYSIVIEPLDGRHDIMHVHAMLVPSKGNLVSDSLAGNIEQQAHLHYADEDGP